MAGATRKYRSPLREAQAEETRRRIVEATLRVLGDGASNFTVPAVAKEAKVSLPTVYRLFPNKEALEEAARVEIRERVGVASTPLRSLDDLLARQRLHVTRGAQEDPALHRAQIILNARQLGETDLQARKKWIAKALAKDLKGVRGKERRYTINMIAMLFSSVGAAALWRFGLLNDEGADSISWAVETLIEGAKRSQLETSR